MVAPKSRQTPFEMARDAIAAQIDKYPVGSFVAVPAHGVTCARVLGAMFTGTISEFSSTSGVQLLVAVGPQTAALTADMAVPVPDPGHGLLAALFQFAPPPTPAQDAALRELRDHAKELACGGRFVPIQRPGDTYGAIADLWAEDAIAVADLAAARTHVGTRTRIAEALLEPPAVVEFLYSGPGLLEARRLRPMPCERNPVWTARPRGRAWEVVERWGPQGGASLCLAAATEAAARLCIAWRAASIWAKPDGSPRFVGKVPF